MTGKANNSKPRGRPKRLDWFEYQVWAAIELARDRKMGPERRSVRDAAAQLTKRWPDYTVSALRRMHREAETKMRHGVDPADVEAGRERELDELRAAVAVVTLAKGAGLSATAEQKTLIAVPTLRGLL